MKITLTTMHFTLSHADADLPVFAVCGAGNTRPFLPSDLVIGSIGATSCKLCLEELARLARLEAEEHPHLTISRLRQELQTAREHLTMEAQHHGH